MPSPSKTDLALDRLREVLHYDQQTGIFHWIVRRGPRLAGSIAGTVHVDGYAQIRIDGKLYMAHVLAWFYVHERWPNDQLDHKNMVKSDNRISNLRDATISQNLGNTGKRSLNSSGDKGVYFDPRTKKWRAEIAHVKLGRFENKEAAARAYADAARLRFGEFART
jgi:hypothetical protein